MLRLGTIVQDLYGGKVTGTYIVSNIPSAKGLKKALLSIDGYGIANGFFNTLEELEIILNQSDDWNILDLNIRDIVNERLKLMGVEYDEQ